MLDLPHLKVSLVATCNDSGPCYKVQIFPNFIDAFLLSFLYKSITVLFLVLVSLLKNVFSYFLGPYISLLQIFPVGLQSWAAFSSLLHSILDIWQVVVCYLCFLFFVLTLAVLDVAYWLFACKPAVFCYLQKVCAVAQNV